MERPATRAEQIAANERWHTAYHAHYLRFIGTAPSTDGPFGRTPEPTMPTAVAVEGTAAPVVVPPVEVARPEVDHHEQITPAIGGTATDGARVLVHV